MVASNMGFEQIFIQSLYNFQHRLTRTSGIKIGNGEKDFLFFVWHAPKIKKGTH